MSRLRGVAAAAVTALAAGCAAASPSVVARDDPYTTVCALVTDDGTVQVAVSPVENTGTQPARFTGFVPAGGSDGVSVVGAYLTPIDDRPTTGDPFDGARAAADPLTIEPGATELLVYGLSVGGKRSADVDGVSFTYVAGGRTFTGRTNVKVHLATAGDDCLSWSPG